MANELVRFTTGLKANLGNESKQAGKVLFVLNDDDSTGSIYFDKDNSHRYRMSYDLKDTTNTFTASAAAVTTTSGRVYPVALDKDGFLAVNVPWTNTTYSAGNGLYLSSLKFYNTGVLSIASGDTNGTIKVTTGTNAGGTSSVDVAVKGLKDLAYIAKPSANTTTTYLRGDGTWVTPPNTTYNGSLGVTLSGTTFKASLVSETQNTAAAGSGKLYAVQLDKNGKLAVNVPWTDNDHQYTASGKGITLSGTQFALSLKDDTFKTTDAAVLPATANTNRTYPLVLDKNSVLAINVPWTDTTYGPATTGAAGLMSAADKQKLDGIAEGAKTGTVTSVATGVGLTGGTITTSGTIKVKLKDETLSTYEASNSTASGASQYYTVTADKKGDLAVYIPWLNTTYSPGTGITIGSGNQINHSNSITAGTAKGDNNKTLTWSGTFTIPTVTYDAQGHITATGTTTMTMPANPHSETIYTGTAPISVNSSTKVISINNGAIANAKLQNSSLSIAGNSVSLGGSLAADTLRASLGLSTAMHYRGKATVALSDGGTQDPTITGYDFANDKMAGDVVIDKDSSMEYVWSGTAWERLGSETSFKTIQAAKSSPSASGTTTSFIDTISQDTNGVITATKKTVTTATTSAAGITTLNATTANTLLNQLTTGSSTPVDADYYISQYVGGGTTTTTYHRRPMSALWAYIKEKINATTDAFSISISGTAATATTANKLGTNAGSATQPVYFANGIPVAITGNIANGTTGNAATATKFASAQSITLTGDVTGTASSQAGWSVATTLANSGVTASSYGPAVNVSPTHGGTFTVPYFTVDAKGRITAASSKTITLPTDSNTDTLVTQTNTTGNASYRLLLSENANDTTETKTARKSTKLQFNPSSGRLTLGDGAHINQAAIGTYTANVDNGSSSQTRYVPVKWTFDLGFEPVTGDTIVIKTPGVGHDWGTYISTDNGANYHPIAVYVGGSRLTTHYGTGSYIHLVYDANLVTKDVFAIGGSNSRQNVTGSWYVLNFYDSNSDWGYYSRRIYTSVKAGSNKIFPYTLILKNADGRYESNVTSSTTATSKAKNTHGFLLEPLLWMYANATYNENVVVGTYNLYHYHSGLIDGRYSFNVTTSSGFTANRPIYLVGTINATDGLFYLDDDWWTQTLPTTEDGKVYIYLGDAYDAYRLVFINPNPVYYYSKGGLRTYSGYAEKSGVANKAIAANITTNTNGVAYYTNTSGTFGNIRSASGAFYSTGQDVAPKFGTLPVAQGGTNATSISAYAVVYGNSSGNGYTGLGANTTTTKKFLRMTGTGSAGAAPAWDTVTKSDVGLGNVENTKLSTWAGSTNITTLGTVTTGTWSATTIAVNKGGTGKTSWAAGNIIYASDTTTLAGVAVGSSGQILSSNGTGAPSWINQSAITAGKLGTTTVGGADRPIYLNLGTATQTTYRMAGTNATATTARAITDNLETGIWYVNGTNSTDLYSIADGAAYVNKYSDSWIAEIYQDYRTGQIALRGKNNGTWQDWRKVLDSSNYTTWTVTKTGSGASGTWGISISGNAATATTANKLGTTSAGSATKPIYWANGIPAEANTYAGGTAVTLNGTSKASSTASFYAPTGAGTSGQYLKSSGSGAPTWETFPTSYPPSTHSHGNITNDGKTSTAITLAANDFIVVGDNSDGGKIGKGPVFDGSTATKALTQKGTWETFNNYSLPLATASVRGGVKIGYTTSGKNYAVQLSNEQMYVNVPWTDTDTKVTQSANTENKEFPILLKNSNTTTAETATVKFTQKENEQKTTINPSTGTISAGSYKVAQKVQLQYDSDTESLNFVFI